MFPQIQFKVNGNVINCETDMVILPDRTVVALFPGIELIDGFLVGAHPRPLKLERFSLVSDRGPDNNEVYLTVNWAVHNATFVGRKIFGVRPCGELVFVDLSAQEQ